MPCFDVNTKLGTAMIDSLCGPVKVNNFLAALNLKPISNRNLKKMEERAGEIIEELAVESTRQAAVDAFEKEMKDVACLEMQDAQKCVEADIDDLGVSLLPDAQKCVEADIDDLGVSLLPDESPSLRLRLQAKPSVIEDTDWSDDETNGADEDIVDIVNHILPSTSSPRTPVNRYHQQIKCKPVHRSVVTKSSVRSARRINLASKFPCRTRSGMSCAIDTAWQKRGFDSLTSHTFLMSKAKYGKKVVKTVVSHRTCGTCNWWRRNRPGKKVRTHKCVKNHCGSARLMESVSGESGIIQLAKEGTPVEYLEGDGDSTLIARLKKNLNINMKKRFDRNHIVKNVGKSLYALHNQKDVKLSIIVIIHLEKCLKYAFAKNQGDKEALRENLRALVPHQYGDHSLCHGRFCGYRRKPGEVYVHRSLPYKTSLKDETLREKLQAIFNPLISNAGQYADLGSSQQCEHANKEVSLRAPKSHHYGNSKSLDYRVHATAAFVNEGRHYISEANKKMGLSPGVHTVKYADTCQKRRVQKQQKQQLPSVKRRRLVLKQERATNQGAQEALEGVSYQSGVGHEVSDIDVEKLPDAVPRGNFQPVKIQNEPTFISVDLETTDLIRGGLIPHITQIAAMDVKSGARFSVYVKPELPISSEAQRVTSICMEDNGEMFVTGKRVECVSVKTAIVELFHWLQRFSDVIFVAHNGRRFDFPILMSVIMNTNSTDLFLKHVSGFVDSLQVFRKKYPGLSQKQVDLVQNLLGITYDAHNAVADVEALGKLLLLCNSSDLMSFSFSPVAVKNSIIFRSEKEKNSRSLDPLVSNGVCKRPTVENIAGSGLALGHLKVIYRRAGEDGLRNIFTAKNSDGLSRVTNVKKVLDEVIPKMAQYFGHPTSEQ